MIGPVYVLTTFLMSLLHETLKLLSLLSFRQVSLIIVKPTSYTVRDVKDSRQTNMNMMNLNNNGASSFGRYGTQQAQVSTGDSPADANSYLVSSSPADQDRCMSLRPFVSTEMMPLSRAASASNMSMTPQMFRSPATLLIQRRRSEMSLFIDCFNSLPDEILLIIIGFVPKTTLARLSLVNKRFRRICSYSTLWRQMDLGRKTRLNESVVHVLINRGLKYLRLARASLVPDIASQWSCRSPGRSPYTNSTLSALTHLDLSNIVLADVKPPSDATDFGCASSENRDPDQHVDVSHVVAGILQRCVHLMALSLEFVHLSDEVCLAIGKNRHLNHLNLSMASGISDTGAHHIVKGCTRLVELNLSWTTMIAESAISILCRNLGPSLRRINLSGGRKSPAPGVWERKSVGDEDIVNLCARSSQLVEVDISDCSELTNCALDALMTLNSLQILHANRCYGIEPINFTLCDRLVELNMMGCVTDEGVEVVRGRLPKTSVNVTYFSTIARPTVGPRRTSIWGVRTRDD